MAVSCARRPDQVDLLLRHADLAVQSARETVADAAGRLSVDERHLALVAMARKTREKLSRTPVSAAP